ncbi:DUF5995 family protein [Oceanihabitans sp. 2_MG-2023]|uniref:DUF5995 family protein n=1 Tax=Oceanihabitans sp. 2_MG-2023 TaxID=3062661 RepID=UPI0026E3A895|nr:DUF5995 family protein [Oceanihabitans sp. 2_MG-2023]MDO6597195.1 DUF5995 family protein [Oceanihabitans sp. 2_MG-2023]
MSRATTIQEVLHQLDAIIEQAILNNDRVGLFAFIYRRTTAEIQKEILLGNFEDNERLEKLDVAFANLYLDAHANYSKKTPVSKSWEFAFYAKNESLTILQHILLGMNAHINLDLSISTSTTMVNSNLITIENDFNKVNDILFHIVNEMQDRLSKVSRLMFLLDFIGKKTDEKIIDFSMRKARQQAWNNANLLWALGNNNNTEAINKIDLLVVKLSQIIKSPKSKILKFALQLIGKFEEKNVGLIISKLKA